MEERRVLAINTGSSGLKATLYRLSQSETIELKTHAERIGQPDARLRLTDPDGGTLLEQHGDLRDHDAALRVLLQVLQERAGNDLTAIGHRVVHGGAQYRDPHLVTDELIAALRGLMPVDPEHLPAAIGAIEACLRYYPDVPQVACFDTAFHRRMPRTAQLYALPRKFADAGVVRYGFHGLSYEYILGALREEDPIAATGRVIIAHLGNGSSMAAVSGGVGVDTTMGFTPTGGLPMGTRTGDLDPGILLYPLQQEGMSPAEVSETVNKRSGLLGVSGSSADMRDLLAREPEDRNAAEAIELYCYNARKHLGALVAALGGLDTLVFTGGIGEHSAPVRLWICEGLEFFGIRLDPGRNSSDAGIISRSDATATVRVMQTNEDLMIARHAFRMILHEGGIDVSL